jgi:quercetin dioxygenase-like cupin family protein
MCSNGAWKTDPEILDVLGPAIQYLTPLSEDDNAYCMLRATVPPGVVVPIHSHADRETFYILAGELEALTEDSWQTFTAGEVFDVPGHVKHAFRNMSGEGVLVLVVTTMAMGRFFREVGRPISNVPPGVPSRAVIERFKRASLAEGHWLGDAEDNAAVGIALLSFN